MRIIAPYFLIGIVLLLAFLSPKILGRKNYIPEEGQVADVQQYGVKAGKQIVWDKEFPVINFTVDGEEWIYQKPNEFLLRKFRPGTKVGLLVHREDPKRVFVRGVLGYWLPLPRMILLLLFYAVAAGFWSVGRGIIAER